MNNTPKTVESLINEAETKWASQGRTDEQKWAVRNFITGSMQEAITALNELKSELTKQQVVSALQQTALDHIVGGDYEDLLTKNLNAELRAEGLTDTDVAKYVSTTQQTEEPRLQEYGKRKDRSGHALALAYFMWDECHCKDVEFQSYDNQVSMKTPFALEHRDDHWVSIDTCIATEIGYLWNNGIETWNSCCGHQKIDATAIINPKSYEAIEALGYKQYAEAPSGLRAYVLKTGHHNE